MTKVAAGFVIFRKCADTIEYLLLQTSYGIHHWTPPKGHVDPGETDEMVTAYRETQEESGLIDKDIKVFCESKKELNYLVKGKPKRVVYWLAELTNFNAKITLSDEHIEYNWFPIKEACDHAKYEDMINLLCYYDDFIKSKKL